MKMFLEPAQHISIEGAAERQDQPLCRALDPGVLFYPQITAFTAVVNHGRAPARHAVAHQVIQPPAVIDDRNALTQRHAGGAFKRRLEFIAVFYGLRQDRRRS